MLFLPKSKTALDRFFFVLNIVFSVLAVAALTAGFWWFLTVRWGSRTWSDLKLQEMMYTLLMPMEGVDNDMLRDHITSCVIPAVIVGIIAAIIVILIFKRRFALHIAMIVTALAGAAFAVVGFGSAWEVLDLSGYMQGQEQYSSFIDENYVDPSTIPLEFPEEKRNLIYIFLESVENTFADESVGGAFEKNVIPELTQLSLENENFSGGNTTLNGGHAMTGATWTVGAMFAQSSGLPLLISINSNSMSLQDEFFPGVTNLGDVLEKEGYHQTIMMGSDATFGGRRLLYTQHGNYDIHDYGYFLEKGIIPDDYFVWWGFEDEYLFAQAKKELAELGKSDEPFNFTILTVDTHFEDGYVCGLCKDEFGDQYSNVYACSSRQTADFVKWIQDQPFYENTTIVIAGDHKTMDKDFCNNVSANYDRTPYFTIINPAVEPQLKTAREYSTFDYFPTTLAALGVQIPGNRLGLGVNLFSSEKTLYENYGQKLFEQGLNTKSELMENLTEGIKRDNLGHLKVGEYNSETGTVEIHAEDVILPETSSGLICYVWPGDDQTIQKRYDGVAVSEDDYKFTVNIADFSFTEGKYNIHLYSQNKNRNTFLAATTMMVDDPKNGEGVYMVETTPQLEIGEYDYATGYVTVSFLNVPDGIISMNLAVWAKEDQSDLKWVEMTMSEDGIYQAEIPAADYGTLGIKYNFHLYGINLAGENKALATAVKEIG